MAEQKPLPAIPSDSQTLTMLCVEGRKHRSRFLRQVLTEEGQEQFHDTRDVWIRVLEDALDELGQSISKGGWLAGIRHGRRMRNTKWIATEKARAEAQKRVPEDTVKGRKNVNQKSLPGQCLEQDPARSPDEVPHSKLSLDSEETTLGLKSIRGLLAQPNSPGSKPVAKHLLLCVAPLTGPVADTNLGTCVPSVGCKFSAGVFILPDDEPDDQSTLLFGFDGSETSILSPEEGPVRLVGGSFTFTGVMSPLQYGILMNALRIATYVQLALLLEQQLLANSHVQLVFPKPRRPAMTLSFPPTASAPELNTTGVSKEKHKTRNYFLPSRLLTLFSKKTESHRPTSTGISGSRGGSLDLARPLSRVADRSSEDGGGNQDRRLSSVHDAEPPFPKSSPLKEDTDLPFTSLLKRIEHDKDLLSTSTNISYPLPSLLVNLAEKERTYPTRRLKGDEKTALSSISGWEWKGTPGQGICGISGFVRQQTLSVLYSQHVPSSVTIKPPFSTKSSSSSIELPQPPLDPCGRPQWTTYIYYSRDRARDRSLGETITEMIACAWLPCGNLECQLKRGEHETRLVHAGTRITINIHVPYLEVDLNDEDAINTWESCSVCNAKTGHSIMSDGAYLLSFAKFLELLLYSPSFCKIHPPLCEHTTPSSQSRADSLSDSRLHILWHFEIQSCVVTFALSTVQDIFELRVPRLQIVRSYGDRFSGEYSDKDVMATDGNSEEDKRKLRGEIRSWWEGVSDHIDKLEGIFSDDDVKAIHKALPRLPSSDNVSESNPDDEVSHAHIKPVSGLLNSSLGNLQPAAEPDASTEYFNRQMLSITPQISSPPPRTDEISDSLHLLSKLRFTFQRTEQSLYSQLSKTPESSLNDVRRSFLSASRGASRRLVAWQNKHLPPAVRAEFEDNLVISEPEWWDRDCHTMPGGSVIVREDDWGSIIAFTLGTPDYHRELADMSADRVSPNQPLPQLLTPTSTTSSGASFFAPTRGLRFFNASAHGVPDPDQDDVIWSEPESFSSIISRKEHPKDASYLLSIREVLRQKAPEGLTDASLSRIIGTGASPSKGSNGPPPDAWAKPDVKLSAETASGEIRGHQDTVESVGKILHELGSAELSSSGSAISSSFDGSACVVDPHIRRGSSLFSSDSDVTVGPENGYTSQDAPPPAVPSKDPVSEPQVTSSQSAGTASSLSSTLTSSLTYAMRLVLNNAEQPETPLPAINRHGLLSADISMIDERPHIKYDWTVGKRLKFSCTIYYAKQFDLLRCRCGINGVYQRSLSRSTNWAADGGKSRSNFWKTADDRFIIKTLVNAWNVADLEVLLELAPSYFRYVESTTNKATILAKLLGFYTIEIRNLESGTVQSKADLLVMENLFYQQKIVQAFDLKGIQGRRVKTRASNGIHSKTLFDGEWIEGQQRTLTLVQPYSKLIFNKAVKNDTEFLASSNIMDYSLLLGVDEEHKQIVCGLVDTIGSYTFAKTLEYKAKQGLHPGKDVTVVPPAEYQERFVTTLEGYFQACPDKWTIPLNNVNINDNSKLLPSVL